MKQFDILDRLLIGDSHDVRRALYGAAMATSTFHGWDFYGAWHQFYCEFRHEIASDQLGKIPE